MSQQYFDFKSSCVFRRGCPGLSTVVSQSPSTLQRTLRKQGRDVRPDHGTLDVLESPHDPLVVDWSSRVLRLGGPTFITVPTVKTGATVVASKISLLTHVQRLEVSRNISLEEGTRNLSRTWTETTDRDPTTLVGPRGQSCPGPVACQIGTTHLLGGWGQHSYPPSTRHLWGKNPPGVYPARDPTVSGTEPRGPTRDGGTDRVPGRSWDSTRAIAILHLDRKGCHTT